MVPFVSEHAVVRPKINEAGSRFIQAINENPDVAKLAKKPGLFVFDGRSIPELVEKIRKAQLGLLGNFIMRCAPKIVVTRIDLKGKTREEVEANLDFRNNRDRERTLAKMSLPEDFVHSVDISDAVRRGDELGLRAFAREVAVNPANIPLVLDTANTSEAQTKTAMPIILSGLISSSTFAR